MLSVFGVFLPIFQLRPAKIRVRCPPLGLVRRPATFRRANVTGAGGKIAPKDVNRVLCFVPFVDDVNGGHFRCGARVDI